MYIEKNSLYTYIKIYVDGIFDVFCIQYIYIYVWLVNKQTKKK